MVSGSLDIEEIGFEFGELNSSKMRQGAGLARMNESRGNTDKLIPTLALPRCRMKICCAIIRVVLASGPAGYGMVDVISNGLSYSRVVETDLDYATGVKPEVGFNWRNGGFQSVTATFPRVYADKPPGELAERCARSRRGTSGRGPAPSSWRSRCISSGSAHQLSARGDSGGRLAKGDLEQRRAALCWRTINVWCRAKNPPPVRSLRTNRNRFLSRLTESRCGA
jgi:hypothetical protein